MVKRNDIVCSAKAEQWIPYGRVSRVFRDGSVEVIDCCKGVARYWPSELEVCNHYKGFWLNTGATRERFPVFVRMPSLRKLKQMAARYNEVWGKGRPYPSWAYRPGVPVKASESTSAV